MKHLNTEYSRTTLLNYINNKNKGINHILGKVYPELILGAY